MALLITFDFPIQNQLDYFHHVERALVETRLSQSTAQGVPGARSLHTIVLGVHATGRDVYRISLLRFLKIAGSTHTKVNLGAQAFQGICAIVDFRACRCFDPLFTLVGV